MPASLRREAGLLGERLRDMRSPGKILNNGVISADLYSL